MPNDMPRETQDALKEFKDRMSAESPKRSPLEQEVDPCIEPKART